MSVVPITRGSRVLHIRPGTSPSASADKIDAWLRAAAVDVEVCGDVYRGLARILRRGTEAPSAVLVCIDDLGSAEFEFFSLAAASRSSAKVYVYGDERWESRVARALDLGAAGRATEQVIRTLVPPPARAEPLPSPEPKKVVPTEREALPEPFPAPANLAGTVEPIAQEPKGPLSRGEEAPRQGEARESAVRVPWLRYGSTPSRTPPSRQHVRPEPPAPAPPHRPPPADREPLLTEEELRALIGDDIAAIAPAEHETDSGEDGAKRGEPS